MYGHAPTFPSLIMRLYPRQTCYKEIKPCACSIRSCYIYASLRHIHSLAGKIMSYITGMTGIKIISLIGHIEVSQGKQPSKILAITFDLYMYNDSREGHMDLAHLRAAAHISLAPTQQEMSCYVVTTKTQFMPTHSVCGEGGGVSVKCARLLWRKKKCSLCSVKTPYNEDIRIEVWLHCTRRK